MFEILDIFLGLAFVYLLLSLVCTAVNEYIAATLNMRGKHLLRGIRQLLDEAGDHAPAGSPPSGEKVSDHLLRHRLIRGLFSERMWFLRRLDQRFPSYIPARTFSLALLDVLGYRDTAEAPTEGSPPVSVPPEQQRSLVELMEVLKRESPQDLRQVVTDTSGLFANAGIPDAVKVRLIDALGDTRNDLQKLHDSVEVWFNNAMDRVSGAYKRYTQVLLLVIGAVVAIAANADTIEIWRRLATNDKLRDGLANQAVATWENMELALRDSAAKDTARVDSAQAGTTDSVTTGTNTANATTTPTSPRVPIAADSAKMLRDSIAKLFARGLRPDSVPSGDAALALHRAATAALDSTGLDLGWTWAEAARLGWVRKAVRSDSTRVKSDSATAADSARADSARAVASGKKPKPIQPVKAAYADWVRQPVSAWHWGRIWSKVLGLLLTAIALSLGAPFWFDMLNKIINVRAAGRAPQEHAKSPGADGNRAADRPIR